MPKIVSILLLIVIFILPSKDLFAFFSDFESSISNTFLVGTLDFSLFSPQSNFVPISKSSNMEPGDRVERMIQVRQQGSLSFEYSVQTIKIEGDNDLCETLELQAKMQGVIKYSGGLMNFFSTSQMNNNNHTWQFKVSLPDGISNELAGKFCKFKFVFEARQDTGSGFYDQEEIENIIITADQFQESPPSNTIHITTSLERSH